MRTSASLQQALLGIVLLCAGCTCSRTDSSPAMTPERMLTVIRAQSVLREQSSQTCHFAYENVEMWCVWDTDFDRMRIFAPITFSEDLDDEMQQRISDANFHTALDARYATSEGVVHAVFIHPLSGLTEAELRSALRQVASLVRTFGTSFSSGEVGFGQLDHEASLTTRPQIRGSSRGPIEWHRS